MKNKLNLQQSKSNNEKGEHAKKNEDQYYMFW